MKVLIVDDEVIIGRAIQRAFVAAGHEVSLAHTGIEGLEKWQNTKPDVVFLDVIMPGLTGPQVIEEFKKRNNGKTIDTHIFLMSAHSDVNQEDRAKAAGADGFIPKPFENIFDIVKKAESAIRKGDIK